MSETREQLEAWLKTIEVKGKVLDVGGSQNSIKGRTKSWDVKDCEILDLKVPHEKKQDVDITCNLSRPAIQQLSFYDRATYGKYFDVAFCIEVSEYWWNPIVALENIG